MFFNRKIFIHLKLPEDFLNTLPALGPSADGLGDALADGEAITAIRINDAKGARAPAGAEPVGWCKQGFYLAERVLFAADPAWHQGLYYVQEPSSMAASHAMSQLVELRREAGRPLRVLDACAAPGGKTIGILQYLEADDFVVANEYDPHRCDILLENLAKYGADNVAVCRGDARAFSGLPEAFDIIAADVPCSGEGMMRKEEAAVAQWSEGLVRQCAALQRDILESLWRALAPGGYLLYSTCTFNKAENEDNLRHMVENHGAVSVPLALEAMPGVAAAVEEGIHGCRFYPGRIRGEGQFVGALQKPLAEPASPAKGRRSTGQHKSVANPSTALMKEPENFVCSGKETIYAVRTVHAAFVQTLCAKVKAVRPGLPVAQLKGRDYVPSHELVLSRQYLRGSLPEVELDRAAALEYLRGKAMTELPGDLPRGYFAPTYGGLPLGLAKCVGSRANNLYPSEQRLRLPAEATASTNIEIIER